MFLMTREIFLQRTEHKFDGAFVQAARMVFQPFHDYSHGLIRGNAIWQTEVLGRVKRSTCRCFAYLALGVVIYNACYIAHTMHSVCEIASRKGTENVWIIRILHIREIQ